MTLTTYKWSIEEWHKLVDAGLLSGKPVEFLEGEIVTVSPEEVEHRYTNSSIVKYLRSIFDKTAEIQESHPITLDNSEPEPDVAVVRLPETMYRTRHPYPQDIYWLIEISNRTLKTDLNQKKITYARNGIPEYWVIDLINNKLIVHTQIQDNNYTQVNEYTKGTVSPLAFPNVAISLDKLLLY
ncbi:MAG: Uma2 family endonuclease [Cyanobacteria bacterium P01_C01_bin.72]